MRRLLEKTGIGFSGPGEEAAFYEVFIAARVQTTRAFLLLSAGIFYIFFIWDRMIDPVGWEQASWIRGAVVVPVLILCLVAMSLPAFHRWLEWIVLISWAATIVGLSVIYKILADGYDNGAAGMVLVLMGAPMMLAMRLPFIITGCAFGMACFLSMQMIAGNARPGMMVVNALCLITAATIVLFSSFVHERGARERFLTKRLLDDARVRVDDLLHSILPQDIVRRIHDGETAIADSYGEVSIVFADLVGFTELTRRVSPSHLVEILNQLFSEFDLLAEKYGIDKIKTIGDAYMAVGGLSASTDRRDHAARAADFALAMHDTVVDLAESTKIPFNIRVGLHVGPVVAGVIGVKRPAFDCWGESVNLASRLESGAEAGDILISESAYWRLQAAYDIDVLEDVDLKGIGRSKVFSLKSARVPQETGTKQSVA